MSKNAKQEITVLLKKQKQGDKSTQSEIMQILYQELRGFAGNILNKENQTITFQATELVNEAFIGSMQDLSLATESLELESCTHVFAYSPIAPAINMAALARTNLACLNK